jgi:hypothetical protein
MVVVARDGIETPTPAFSGPVSFIVNQLIRGSVLRRIDWSSLNPRPLTFSTGSGRPFFASEADIVVLHKFGFFRSALGVSRDFFSNLRGFGEVEAPPVSAITGAG